MCALPASSRHPLKELCCARQDEQGQQLTPEQLKALKGPSRDDPAENVGAASWVEQYNEELAAPSRNATECEAHSYCLPFISDPLGDLEHQGDRLLVMYEPLALCKGLCRELWLGH